MDRLAFFRDKENPVCNICIARLSLIDSSSIGCQLPFSMYIYAKTLFQISLYLLSTLF